MAAAQWDGDADMKLVPTSSGKDNNNPRPTTSHSAGTSTEYFESVVSMLSILSSADQTNAHRALLAITNSPESCQALRKAGCIPLLIQILHPVNLPPNEHPSVETKARATRALKNIVHFNPDFNQKRKEMRVLKLLESIRSFSEQVRVHGDCPHPLQSTTTLMKLSFDEEHRLTMCHLGAIHAVADLIQADHSAHGLNLNPDCTVTRRYSGMILTNLTFGDGTNKALLCSMHKFLTALVAQLDYQNEDVCQVTASVLRNLSWHADSNSRIALRDSNVVTKLTSAAIRTSKESTLKATLSALWNLSAHSVANKSAICHTENAVEFLVGLLGYKSSTLTIVENAGGILRNVATILPTDDSIRRSFRECGLIEVLLEQLRSSSLTVVSNACGTLWHVSGNCPQDQQRLIDLGAMPKLKALMYSKHERIAQGANAAFKNLLAYSSKTTCIVPEQQPIDLRRSVDTPPALPLQEASKLRGELQEEPLDLSMHSSKSSPIHIVSASEFGARTSPAPAFLNPPLQPSSGARKYYSPKNYNSCPELMRFLQPAHQTKALDCSKSETLIVEDTTTNYSLHFSEAEDLPSNKCEDTTKTYFCEGTPLNFSTATSMNDLTQLDKPKLKPIAESEAGEDQPRKYCTEHTPANFSRASSLSSIASNVQGGENKAELLDETQLPLKQPTPSGAPKEKVKRNVTFSANETPLMFSRSSSVNSLASIDVNYEDGGSVMSEFSRRTSEAVSPSDLPDSPRQLGDQARFMQEEKLKPKAPEESPKVFTAGESAPVTGAASVRSLSPLTVDGESVGVALKMETSPGEGVKPALPTSAAKSILKHGRGELDELRVFAIEGTPFGVSNATSLSDLVCDIDKEPEPATQPEKPKEPPAETSAAAPAPAPEQPSSEVEGADPAEEPIYSDAQILMKCISAGKASRIPKSKSEVSQLGEAGDEKEGLGGVKTSASYHEDLKPGDMDEDLAALILKGKNKARSSARSHKTKQSGQGKAGTGSRDKEGTQETGAGPGAAGSLPTGQGPHGAITSRETPPIQQSVLSIASEWNDDTPTLSSTIPSMTISSAFRLVEERRAQPASPKPEAALVESTLTSVQPPSLLSAMSSTECKRKTYTKDDNTSNLLNQRPPPDLDLENSMISVASLQSEVASTIDNIETGIHQLSLAPETYTIDGSYDEGTDVDDSLREDVSLGSDSRRGAGSRSSVEHSSHSDRFLTFTKSHASPRQRRQEDPTRYLTRTITPVDANGNASSPTTPTSHFATFKVDRTGRAGKPLAATSNESSPTGSPRSSGIRGRRKQLYASLPPQRKVAPPIPPKPRTPVSGSGSAVFVRPTRSSELRAALSSRDSSPRQSRHSSRNSSTSSLNNLPQQAPPPKKIPPKPPVRSSVPSKNFAVVRAVRNSNSSIGFSSDPKQSDSSAYSTLPRSGKAGQEAKEKEGKVGRLSSFWNQLTNKQARTESTKPLALSARNGNENEGEEGREKKTRFGIGFNFGRKRKEVWVKREGEASGKDRAERERAFVLPFNYNHRPTDAQAPTTTTSKMTTV